MFTYFKHNLIIIRGFIKHGLSFDFKLFLHFWIIILLVMKYNSYLQFGHFDLKPNLSCDISTNLNQIQREGCWSIHRQGCVIRRRKNLPPILEIGRLSDADFSSLAQWSFETITAIWYTTTTKIYKKPFSWSFHFPVQGVGIVKLKLINYSCTCLLGNIFSSRFESWAHNTVTICNIHVYIFAIE